MTGVVRLQDQSNISSFSAPDKRLIPLNFIAGCMGLILVQCWHPSEHPSNLLGLSTSPKEQGKMVSDNLGAIEYLLMSEASVLLYCRRAPLWKERVSYLQDPGQDSPRTPAMGRGWMRGGDGPCGVCRGGESGVVG